jgi:hypothetical protein
MKDSIVVAFNPIRRDERPAIGKCVEVAKWPSGTNPLNSELGRARRAVLEKKTPYPCRKPSVHSSNESFR